MTSNTYSFHIQLNLSRVPLLYDYESSQWLLRPESGGWDQSVLSKPGVGVPSSCPHRDQTTNTAKIFHRKNVFKEMIAPYKVLDKLTRTKTKDDTPHSASFSSSASVTTTASSRDGLSVYPMLSHTPDVIHHLDEVPHNMPTEHQGGVEKKVYPYRNGVDGESLVHLPPHILPMYRVGDKISGVVVLNVVKPIKRAQVSLKFKGEAVATVEGIKTTEVYFDKRVELYRTYGPVQSSSPTSIIDFGPDPSRGALTPGAYHWPFQFTVPNSASSCPIIGLEDDWNRFYVCHRIKGKIECPDWYFNLITTRPFLVRQRRRPVEEISNFEPQHVIRFHKTGLLSPHDEIRVLLKTDTKRLVHGSSFPITVEIANPTPTNLSRITANLQMELTQNKTDGGSRSSFWPESPPVKPFATIFSKSIELEPMPAHSHRVMSVELPWDFSDSCCDSNLMPLAHCGGLACPLVEVNYVVNVALRRRWFQPTIVANLPLVIVEATNDDVAMRVNADETKLVESAASEFGDGFWLAGLAMGWGIIHTLRIFL